MRTLAVAIMLAAVGLAAVADDKARETKKIEGRYELVGGEDEGKKLPRERHEGSVVVISKDTIYGHDKDRKQFFSAKYSLDTSKKPWRLSMVSKAPKEGERAEGIAMSDGETLKICYALPGGETPTDFTTKEKQHCFILKKVTK